MDYGQTTQPPDTPEFFTSGVGTNNEKANNFDSDNLNSSNPQVDWGTPIDKDPQNVGSQVINSIAESNQSEPNQAGISHLEPNQAGISQSESNPTNPNQSTSPDMLPMPEVVSLNPAIQNPAINTTLPSEVNEVSNPEFNIQNVKTTEFLSKDGEKAVDAAIAKFNQDGDPAALYKKVRNELTGINLENSYGRKAPK